jgi:hypothetical protein
MIPEVMRVTLRLSRSTRQTTFFVRDSSMFSTSILIRRRVTPMALGLLLGAGACQSSVHVASDTLDTLAVRQFKTFTVSAPKPPVDRVAVAATNDRDRVGGAAMDMDPMLSTSLVGRAIRQDLTSAFAKRGYQGVTGAPDFYVAYYAGTGRVVDSRASATSYHSDGQKITTQTYEYPAGTIVVDVVNARSDSLVWRGTGVAEIPHDPADYAKAIHSTVDKIVMTFPRAPR